MRKKRNTFKCKRSSSMINALWRSRKSSRAGSYGPSNTPDMIRKRARRAAVWTGARA